MHLFPLILCFVEERILEKHIVSAIAGIAANVSQQQSKEGVLNGEDESAVARLVVRKDRAHWLRAVGTIQVAVSELTVSVLAKAVWDIAALLFVLFVAGYRVAPWFGGYDISVIRVPAEIIL